MENVAKSGNFGPGTTGMTLQQAVFAGLVDPGNLVAVRGVDIPTSTPNAGASGDCPAPSADGTVHLLSTTKNCDTALYTAVTVTPATINAAYTITRNANGSITVTDNAFAAGSPTSSPRVTGSTRCGTSRT